MYFGFHRPFALSFVFFPSAGGWSSRTGAILREAIYFDQVGSRDRSANLS
jgi:hypothetical protein